MSERKLVRMPQLYVRTQLLMRPVIWLDKDSPSVDLRPKGIRIEGKRIKIRGGMCEGYEFLREN